MAVGGLGFESRLVERRLLSRRDLATAREQALRKGLSLADALIELGLVSERDVYALLSEAIRIAESLTAILAQRLVRRLCPHCRRTHDELEARRRGEECGVRAVAAAPGPGCDHCKQTGYAGRVPVAELLIPSESLRATIARGATAREIRAAMQSAGIASMRQRAMEPVVDGVTSVDEISRVLSGGETGAAATPRGHRVLVADDYILKPFDPDVLFSRVQSMFRRLNAIAA